MNKEEFQKLAVRTESIVDSIKVSERDAEGFIRALQGFVAVTEVLDAFKKHIFYAKDLDRERVMDEMNIALNQLHIASSQFFLAGEDSQDVATLSMDPRIFHALLGTITEHGEIANAMIGPLKNEEELDIVNVCEELGDSDWYKALYYEATGISWDDVQAMIIKKLEIRYADKIFSAEEAAERDLIAEGAVLVSSIIDSVNNYESKRDR